MQGNNTSAVSHHSNHHGNVSNMDLSMDMDMSPYSPGQASDLSEIFEPPKATGSAKKSKKAKASGILLTKSLQTI